LSFPTVEVPFQADSRPAGTTKYTIGRLLGLAGDAVISFSRAPLRLALYVGGGGIAFSLLFGACAGVYGLLGGERFSAAWTALFCSLYLVGGCVLCGLGVVGEYVARIYEQVKGRPLYVLKEASPDVPAWRAGADLGDAA
jgi:dolichol-phosphate mannosyltransferase